ncbi:MAG: 4-phosphoerythronate dehydrogenase PdxB [Tannerellaceae bacterium]|nr:4-phosphoerythronate dehydrogenase PdxB [Tannerellaceae bacterium]
MKIVVDRTIPYLKGVVEAFAEVRYLSAAEFTAQNVREADVLIVRSVEKCTAELLENSRVKLIATATIGFDHIDTAYCEAAGIAWRNAPGSNAASVAQYVAATLVATSLLRREPLKGKTVGIVGVGHVGRQVERVCAALGLRILRNDPPRAEAEGEDGFVSLDVIAEEADIISFHTPLVTKGKHATYHLAGGDFFRRLKKMPWLINTARGAVHDTAALLDAKKRGWAGELILDCWENEPEVNRELLGLATIATPHIAGFSADGKANASRMCLENIGDFFHINIEKAGKITPLPPREPVVDMKRFKEYRVEQAILSAFNPAAVDRAFRENPSAFERFRAHYDYPREYPAYTVIHATEEEAALLARLGFRIGL